MDLTGLPDDTSTATGGVDLGGLPDTNEGTLRQRFRTTKATPDDAAKVIDITRRTGVPRPVVERNRQSLERLAMEPDWGDLEARAPITVREMAAKTKLFELANDDTENLAATEAMLNPNVAVGKIGGPAFRRQASVQPSRGPEATFSSVVSGLFKSLPQGAEIARQGIRMQLADLFGFDATLQDAMRKYQREQFGVALSTPEFESSTARGAYSGGTSLIRQSPGLAASIALRTPLPGLALIGTQTEAEAYGKYRTRGATPGEALLGGVGEGAVEVGTELLPMSFLVGKLGKVGAGEFLAGLLAREVPTEQVATLVQDAIDTAIANPDKTWADYAAERPDAAYQTLVATVTQAGAMGAINTVAQRLGGVQQADQDAQALTALSELAAASKLRARDPASFQEFIEAANEDGPVQDVYLDARTFAQALNDAGIDPVAVKQQSPALAEQLDEALATGSDLVIPISEYAARLAGTDAGAVILPHLRTSEEGLSQVEAQQFYQSQAQEMQAAAAQVMEQKAADEAWMASAKAVETELMGQLQQANRFTPDVNTAYATLARDFYVTTAARLGITPQEMFARYPLQVRAESVAGGNVMDQGLRVETVPVDSFGWYEEDDGYLYHVTSAPNAEGIAAKGFGEGGAMFKGGSYPAYSKGKTFFTDRSGVKFWLGRVEDQLFDQFDDPPGISVVRVPKSAVAGLTEVDEIGTQDAKHPSWFIPSDKLQGVGGGVANAKESEYDADKGDDNALDFTGQRTEADRPGLPAVEDLDTTVSGRPAAQGWAEATRVRRTDGKPAVLYRGASRGLNAADFGRDALGAATGNPSSALGVWFTPHREEAGRYGAVESFHLDLRKPKVIRVEDLPGFDTTDDAYTFREELREQGYDGIAVDARHLGGPVHFVAFDTEQVIRPAAAKPLDMGQFFQPAYHGSPHDFDKFSTDKIGTGEGAQAYGWGLYFAENPGIAAGYHERLAGNPQIIELKLGTMRLTPRNGFDYSSRASVNSVENVRASLAEDLLINEMDLRGAGDAQAYVLKVLDERIADYYNPELDGEMIEAAKQLRKELARKGAVSAKWEKATGGVYQVDIPDEAVAKMLDWDKPLSEQAESVREALEDISTHYADAGSESRFYFMAQEGETGGEIYNSLIAALRDGNPEDEGGRPGMSADDAPREASKILNHFGIPGIKYDDAASRGDTPSKTKNIVVFDDKIVKLTHKDGKPVTQAERDAYFQPAQGGARGGINFGEGIGRQPAVISLLKNADLSTFLHEMGHFQLEVLADIASRPDAPTDVRTDMDALLKWFGVPDLDTWRAMSLDEKRPHHEQFARGFEAYLFEGKAPNVELNNLFARFAAWLKRVYQSIKALNVELNPEVRAVMDRMIATEEAIKEAEAARAYAPLFESAEAMGVTPDEWAAYQKLGADSTQDAVDGLQTRSLRDMQWLTNARSRVLKQLQKEASTKRKEVETEVEAEVRQQPVYAAMRWLRTGETIGPDGEEIKATKGYRLNTDALAEMYPATMNGRPNLNGLRGMTSAEGLAPDLVAEMFGYTSGDQLVRDILAAEPEAAVIEALTDQRMLERYGDLSSPAEISKAADAAIHNDARARFVATELKALSKALTPARAMAKAARDFAESTIARKRLRDIKPNQHAAAEARAAKAAERALAKSDTVAAVTEKRNQLVQNYATRAAYDALTEVDKGVAYLRKFDREGTRKSLDSEYVDQIDRLLERFDLRASTTNAQADKRATLLAWVESQREAGFEPDIPPELLAEASRKPYRELTLEEFRGLTDTVKQIEHLGRLKKKLLTAKDQREFDAVRDLLVANIEEHAKKTVDLRTRNTPGAVLKEAGTRWLAMHRKMASVAREMDGFKDGGPMWEYFIRSMNEAGDRETTMREQATVNLYKLVKPLLAGPKMGGKGVFFPSIGMSLNREERIGIALNIGNAGNLQRLLGGEGWTPEQLRPVLDSITADEADFVQSVWDFFESYRPQIAAKERRLYGKEPDWVEPTVVTLGGKTLKGGYYPIKYDPKRSGRAEQHADAEAAQRMIRGAYTTATTRRSFTKTRAEEVTGRPLLYSLSGLYQGTNEVIHDLAWHEWLVDVNRLLRNKAIDQSIRTHYGAETVGIFKKAIEDIAAGDVPAQNIFERGINHIRTGATIAGLGWNFTTAALQLTGLSQSMVRVGPGWVAKGIGQWMKRPLDTTEDIYAKSEMMRLRAKTLQREINEIQNQVSGGKGPVRTSVEATFFLFIQKMQLVADIPTWLGAYDKAIASGESETRAAALADQAVLDSQGGGQIKDLSQIQRGGPLQKLFTNFYSYFNVTYNLAVEKTKEKGGSPKAWPSLALDYLLLYTIPAVLGLLIREGLKGDLDDDEIPEKLAAEQIGYLLGSMVGLREITAAVQKIAGVEQFKGGYGGPAGLRLLQEIDKLGQQIAQGEADMAAFKAADNVGGVIFHYPSGQINRSVEGARALLEGKTENPAAVLMGPPRD